MAYPSDLVRTKNWGTETLTDADLEGQLDLIINWVMAAQNSSTGHKHDGTSNEGPKLSVLADTVSTNVTFSGTLTLSNDPTFSSGNGLVPSGCILMWSGAISAIPTGWVICDGTNSTPDLTDRFVLHADADSGGTNNVGDTGGASTHTLSAAESGLPAHSHTLAGTRNDNNSSAYTYSQYDGALSDGKTGATGTVSGAAASSAHTNRDKYYALAYIMKS